VSELELIKDTMDTYVRLRPDRLPAWDDVVARARISDTPTRHVHGQSGGRPRRRLLVALAVAAAVAAVGAAAVGAVRYFVLDEGFIGLPPVGATPSAPADGELRLHYFGPVPKRSSGKLRKLRSWLYADGRLISLQDGPLPQGANPRSSGFLERRLTPEGVELLQSEALSIGHWGNEQIPPPSGPPCPNGVSPGTVVSPATVGCVPRTSRPSPNEPTTVPFHLFIEVPDVGRLLRVDHARELDRLVERLTDPVSWLPASAWAVREARAYVPSRFSVCYGASGADPPLSSQRILDLLPATAADALRRKPTTRVETLFGAPGNFKLEGDTCSDLSTHDAREVMDELDAAGIEQAQPRVRLSYRFAAPTRGREVHVYLEPYLPHGEITCSVCG
jgi:hypothetical protein